MEQPLLNNSLHNDDDPIYEICGLRIPLRDVNIPNSLIINHTIPKECAFFFLHYSKMRDDGANFDILVKLNGMEWKAHKALLAVRLPLILIMSNYSQSSSMYIINIPSEFDSTIIESIIDYAYNGCLTICESNAQDMMRVANYLHMEWLEDDCADFLLKRIRFDDALPLLSFFQSINYSKLSPLLTFIDMNFVPIANTLEYIELSIVDLENILKRDSLRIDSEDQVLNAVNRWIGDRAERIQYGMRLLKCIRLNQISSSFITSIEKVQWIMNNQECDYWIKRNDQSGNKRLCEYAPKIVFSALMNDERRGQTQIKIFNPITKSWSSGSIHREKNVANSRGICITWNEEIIFVGGELSSREYAECAMYNTRTNCWSQIPAMRENRLNCVAEVINDKLYCAGGKPEGHNSVKSSLEVLNLADPTRGWTVLPNMRKARTRATSCILNGKFYVFAGLGANEKLWSDGERFDPETNEWTPISPMPNSRYECTAVTLNGLIYIVGEWGTYDTFVDVYSPSTDTWKAVRDFKIPRSSPKVFAMFNKLFVFGGEDENGETVDSVESYDSITDTWKDENPMRGSRYYCGLSISSAYPLPYL